MGEVEDDAQSRDYLIDLRFFNSKKSMEYPNGIDAGLDYRNFLHGEALLCRSKRKSMEYHNKIDLDDSSVDLDYVKFLHGEEPHDQVPEKQERQDTEKEERQKSMDHCNGIYMEDSSADSDYRKFIHGEEQCFPEHDQDPEKEERHDPEKEERHDTEKEERQKSMDHCNGIHVEESSVDSDYGKFIHGEEQCFPEHDQDPEKEERQDPEKEEQQKSRDHSGVYMEESKLRHGEERCFYEHDQDPEEERLDPKSEIFFNNIQVKCKPLSFEILSNSDTEEEDELDSHYELFLKNVNVDGQLFSFEVPSSSGVSMYRFEERSSEVERKITSMRDLRSVKAKVPEKKAKVVKFMKIGDEGIKNVVGGVLSKGRKKVVNMDERSEEDEDDDYCMPDKSSREASKKRKRNSVTIDENHDKLLNSKQGKKEEAVKKFSMIGGQGSKNIVRDVPCERAVNVDQIKEEDEDDNDFVPCKSSGDPSKNMNCVIRGERYYKLRNSLAKRGKNTVFSHEIYHQSRHQKDDESSSDLEILSTDDIPFHEGGYTPFVPSKCYQSLPGEESREVIENSSRSHFREKLINLLKKPYEEKEFEHLWKEITDRKPVQRTKELRGGTKVYPTKADGKSYLDWYSELRVKIDELRPDRQKILYLLRGFFFWLENTAHEGAFKPWLDSSYLKDI